METQPERRDSVLILLDELQPPGTLPVFAGVFRALRAGGRPCELLYVPCPWQPHHPLQAGTGVYRAWSGGPLPDHDAVVATSAATALLALALSSRPVAWVLDRNPFTLAASQLEGELAGRLLAGGLAHGWAVGEPLARELRRRGVDCDALALRPQPAADGRPASGGPLVIDHASPDPAGIALAAASVQFLDAPTLLLTDLLAPPYAASFTEVRIRPVNRPAHYRRGALVIKLDGLHESLTALAAILDSGCPLAAPREVLAGFPVEHGREVWRFSAADAGAVRDDLLMLLAHPDLLAQLASRAQQTARAWAPDAEPAMPPVPSGLPHGARQDLLRNCVEMFLIRADRRAWNGAVLPALGRWFDETGASRLRRTA